MANSRRRLAGISVALIAAQLAFTAPGFAQSNALMDLYNEYKLQLESGNLQIAKTYAERTLDQAERELGHDRALIADRIVDLAEVEARLGEARDAARHYRDAIKLYENALGKDNARIVRPLQALADVYVQGLSMDDAEETHLRAISLLEFHAGRDHINTAIALWNYADFLLDRGPDAEDALVVMDRAENIISRSDAASPLVRFRMHLARGSIQSETGQHRIAVGTYAQAEAIAEDDSTEIPDQSKAELFFEMAKAHAKLQQNREARRYFFRAKPGEPAVIPVFQPPAPMPSTTVPRLAYNMSGRALLEFTLDRDGSPKDIRVVSSEPDSSFGISARRTVGTWRYLPPIDEDGQSVEVQGVRELITFYMEDTYGPKEQQGYSSD